MYIANRVCVVAVVGDSFCISVILLCTLHFALCTEKGPDNLSEPFYHAFCSQ